MFGKKTVEVPEIRQVYIASPSGGFMTRGQIDRGRKDPGCEICGLCGCCSCTLNCANLSFLTTPTGILKVLQFLLSFICQFNLHNWGIEYAKDLGLGIGFPLCLLVSGSSLLTSGVLLVTYTSSSSAYLQVRPSLLEVLLSSVSSLLYFVSSTLLANHVYQELYYFYHTVPGFHAYPALTTVYIAGYAAGVLHAIDGILAIKDWRSK